MVQWRRTIVPCLFQLIVHRNQEDGISSSQELEQKSSCGSQATCVQRFFRLFQFAVHCAPVLTYLNSNSDVPMFSHSPLGMICSLAASSNELILVPCVSRTFQLQLPASLLLPLKHQSSDSIIPESAIIALTPHCILPRIVPIEPLNCALVGYLSPRSIGQESCGPGYPNLADGATRRRY